jgi:uncharacterized coiled-coil DUF342 family protein
MSSTSRSSSVTSPWSETGVFIPFSSEEKKCERDDCSRDVERDLGDFIAYIEESGERYIRKLKRAQKFQTRLAIDEIMAAKEDAIEEIKTVCTETQESSKQLKPEEDLDKVRQEIERLKNSVNMLSQVLFRNSGQSTF